jgi:nitrogenase subunit NifH
MEFNKSVIQNTDTIYAILEPDITMFSNACAVIHRNYKGKRVRYILNKFNENKEFGIVGKLENVISKQIFLKIPLNHMATNASISHGKTLKEISPKLDVVDKYLRLANFIASRE